MAQIPEEYANFDFGFSAVDESELESLQKATAEVEEATATASTYEEKLKKKIDSAIKEIGYKKEYLEEKYVKDMQDVEKLVLPVLYNLMKNPEKEYIYWPNREEIIMKQIEKIKDITRDLSK